MRVSGRGDAADEWWGGVSPPAARQTWPPAAQAFSLSARSSHQRESLSPALADGAPRETTPADNHREDASGHVNITSKGMAAGYDKWDNRKLKGWMTKISFRADWMYYICDARIRRLIRKHHIHLYETVNTFILSRPWAGPDETY